MRRMSSAEFHAAMLEIAEAGALVETGWRGFEAWHDQRGEWTAEQKAMIRWAFWTGARCVGDALPHVNSEQISKLFSELGVDPFCRPPEEWGPRH